MQAAKQKYEKEKLNERIAKLSGGVPVIQILVKRCHFSCYFLLFALDVSHVCKFYPLDIILWGLLCQFYCILQYST